MTPPVPADGDSPPPPPWTWSNLDEKPARDLDAAVQAWVGDYNRHLAVKVDEIIPACWRQHPALTQELPVQYHGWLGVHRDPDATSAQALEYYTKYLPSFRDRVKDLLGGDASKCRVGKHPEPSDPLDRTITLAATDLAAHGPDIIDVLRRTTFGPS
jgi:hypothetical protein